MRGYRKWTLTLVALCACSMPARAADDKAKPVPEEGAVELVLLRHKAVRDDLKLTHREARKIHEFTEQQWKKAQKIEELADEKERDRRYDELTREDERFLAEALTPEQKKRLDQITLQVAGLVWITRPDVAAARIELDRRTEEKGGRLPEAGSQGDGGAAPLGEAAGPTGRASQAPRDLQGARARTPDRRTGGEVP
jgi:Spy/CpxP family protein refolding chaperone